MTIPRVLSRKEAAKAAKLSLSTIDKALLSGELPSKVYGGRTLIFESGLQQFLEGMKDRVVGERSPRAVNAGRKKRL